MIKQSDFEPTNETPIQWTLSTTHQTFMLPQENAQLLTIPRRHFCSLKAPTQPIIPRRKRNIATAKRMATGSRM